MPEVRVDIAREYIEKYIEIGIKNNRGFSKRYIATVLFNEHPDTFNSIEAARTTVRFVLDAKGTRDRHKKVENEIARRFAMIPSPVEELPNPEAFIVPERFKNMGVVADTHGLFCDMDALKLAIEFLAKHKCDSILINGDGLDCYQFSRFDKSPLVVDRFYEEQEWGVEVLKLLQDTFGQVFFKEGNHDLRRKQSVDKLAGQFPDLYDMGSYKNFLSFERSKVEFIEDYRHVRFGKLNIFHGHEYQGGGGIHVAYNRLNKAMDNVMSAHSHKTQSVFRTNINGELYGSWSIGCLCNLHPRYNPKNDWSQGFARVERESDGMFEVMNRMIVNGRTIPV